MRLAVIAGEESGDSRGAALLRELRNRNPEASFFGAGGPRMASLCDNQPGLFDSWIDEAGVVGLWDVLRQYPYFRRKFHALKNRILSERPDAVVFIDYPGFNLRMAAALRAAWPECKLFYYISPQVWAWNRSRIPKMARLLDLMLCLFPFEKPLYDTSGLRTVFVGHPLVEELDKESLDIPDAARRKNLIGFFPGSRDREVHKLFPVYLGAMQHIRASRPDLKFCIAAARARQAKWMSAEAEKFGIDCDITVGQSHTLMRTATAGIVCSGTATLEAAILGLPYALAYKVNWLTYEVGRRLVQVPFLGMVNILAEREVIREFIQENCTPFLLADEILRLINDDSARATLSTKLEAATKILGGKGASQRAAEAILETFMVE